MKTRSEASKRAQKKYDDSHKAQVKRIDIKVDRERYKDELTLLESVTSRQYFLMWLVTEFLNNKDLQRKWEQESEKSGK